MVKIKIGLLVLLGLVFVYVFLIIESATHPDSVVPSKETLIYLYGEKHRDTTHLEKEVKQWEAHYNDGLRYLFVEMEYYRAEMLNEWMNSDDDEWLNIIFEDDEIPRSFYEAIRVCCSDTIFVGTDIGHSDRLANLYLEHLSFSGDDSFSKEMTERNVQQAIDFYEHEDDEIREHYMVENFILLYERLDNEVIAGIYGADHANPHDNRKIGNASVMARQLYERYGDVIEFHHLDALE